MEWIEHQASRSETDWNPKAGRVTALFDDYERSFYSAVVLEEEPGVYKRWDFKLREMVPLPGPTTMEEAQAVCTALYKMRE